jgi:DNA-directed RNA polymerase subunit RPC12/RpoP
MSDCKGIKCSSCNREIKDDEEYFVGHISPPKITGKFGCSPYIYYCIECTQIVHFWWNYGINKL